MPRISLLTPSRGRPSRVAEMWRSAIQTSEYPDLLEIVVRCDKDDLSIQKYEDFFLNDKKAVFIKKKKSPVQSEWYNECFRACASDIMMFCADDLIFETNGWDSAVVKEYDNTPDKILFVFCDDSDPYNIRRQHGTHGFLHRNWVNVTGYCLPPYLHADWGDVWINEVAAMVKRKTILPNYCIRHMHWYRYPNIENDQTYKDKYVRLKKFKVNRRFKATKNKRISDAKKLKKFISNFNSGL